MSVSRNDDSEGLPPPLEQSRSEPSKSEPGSDPLQRLLVQRVMNLHGVGEADARSLVNEALIVNAQSERPNPERWLTALVLVNAQERFRKNARRPAPDVDRELGRTRRMLVTLHGLETLPPNARTALRLRHYDRLSYEAIAAEMQLSVPDAEHLVTSSIAKLLDHQRKKRPEKS